MLDQYTHLAFTSRNGIQAVLDTLQSSCSGAPAPGDFLSRHSIRCCALGADAELLQGAGVSDVLTPAEVHALTAAQGCLEVCYLCCSSDTLT